MNYRLSNNHVNSLLLNVIKPLAVSDWFEKNSNDNFALSFHTYVESQVQNFIFISGDYKRDYIDFVNANKYILDNTDNYRDINYYKDSFMKVWNYYLQDIGIFLLKESLMIYQRDGEQSLYKGLSNIVTAVPNKLLEKLGCKFVSSFTQVSTDTFYVVDKSTLTNSVGDILSLIDNPEVFELLSMRDDTPIELLEQVCNNSILSQYALKGLLYIYWGSINYLGVINER